MLTNASKKQVAVLRSVTTPLAVISVTVEMDSVLLTTDTPAKVKQLLKLKYYIRMWFTKSVTENALC